MNFRRLARGLPRLAAYGAAVVFLALLAAAFLPMDVRYTAPDVRASAGFAGAKAAVERMIAGAPPTLSPEGRPRAFLHEGPTDQVFVLLHGLTNSPEQFDKLGRILFERGHNVVIPLTPGHGKADVMTDKLGNFTAQGMLDAANEAITLARGLGRQLTVAGLSVNGATTAWVAQNRADVDRAVLLAPFFAPAGLPHWAAAPMGRVLVRAPNVFLWWDPYHQADLPGPAHAYPRFSTRSIGETMLLGVDVLDASRGSASACGSILVVTTASDRAASNRITAQLVTNWRTFRPADIAAFEFPAADNVPHDFIDPAQADQRVGFVYPKLVEMLETGRPWAGAASSN